MNYAASPPEHPEVLRILWRLQLISSSPCLSDFAELSQQTHPAVKCFNQIKHLLLTCICRAGQHFARSACTSTPPVWPKKKKKNPLYHPVYSSPAAVLTVLPLSAGSLFVWFLFLFYFFFFPFFAVRRILFDHSVDGCAR